MRGSEKGFFTTGEGKLCIAGLLCLLALPLLVAGANAGSDVCVYGGLGMICLGMAYPVGARLFRK